MKNERIKIIVASSVTVIERKVNAFLETLKERADLCGLQILYGDGMYHAIIQYVVLDNAD